MKLYVNVFVVAFLVCLCFVFRLTIKKIKRFFYKVKICIWNKRILVWRYKNFIPEDEFDNSLNIDVEAMSAMNNQEKEKYIANLVKRRYIAHKQGKDLRGNVGND